MRRRSWTVFPGVLSVTLILTAGISFVLATVLLELFAIRLVDGGSLTTMFPGYVYATALIAKTSLIVSAILFLAAIGERLYERRLEDVSQSAPFWGIVSLLLPAVAPLIGAIVILVGQSLADTPKGFSATYFSEFSRAAVVTMMVMIAVSDVSAIRSLIRRERPIGVAVIGLLTTIVYWVLFLYWEFYRLGFDQDKWNGI